MNKRKTSAFPKPLKRILLAFAVVFLLITAGMRLLPVTAQASRKPVEHSADWMSMLEDSIPLNEIALPGTHDSATEYVQLAFFSNCQSLSVREQLDAGFRYLDIRLAVEGNRLGLRHGFTRCKNGWGLWSGQLLLDSVLKDCYAFLNAHPTETIVFAVKQEAGNESVSTFQKLLNSYLSANPEYWYAGSELPTLGEARGKLVLLRRYRDEAGLGIHAGISLLWPDQGGFSDPKLAFSSKNSRVGSLPLAVQDRYEYTVKEKWAAFCAEPDVSTSDGVVIRFLSTKGHATFGHPHGFAVPLNRQLEIACAAGNAPTGWTILDFGTAELAAMIWRSNF